MDPRAESRRWCVHAPPRRAPLLLSSDRTALSVAITSSYITPGGLPVNNLLAAASVMYVVAVPLIFLVAQRGFVAGMSSSGLK